MTVKRSLPSSTLSPAATAAACWETRHSQGDRDAKGFISHWQGVYEAPPPPSDLVCSIEVAEHIPESLAEQLVEFLTRASRRYVYFTAALPRQPGVGHINCQPSFYWIDRFERAGCHLDVAATRALLDRINHLQPCYWIPQNSLIFKTRPRPARAGGRASD